MRERRTSGACSGQVGTRLTPPAAGDRRHRSGILHGRERSRRDVPRVPAGPAVADTDPIRNPRTTPTSGLNPLVKTPPSFLQNRLLGNRRFAEGGKPGCAKMKKRCREENWGTAEDRACEAFAPSCAPCPSSNHAPNLPRAPLCPPHSSRRHCHQFMANAGSGRGFKKQARARAGSNERKQTVTLARRLRVH